MKILLIDGLLNGTEIDVKEPNYNNILGYSNDTGELSCCLYFPWSDQIYIAEGKGSNVKRIKLQFTLDKDKDGKLIPPNEDEAMEEANQVVRTRYKNKSIRLINYRIHNHARHSNNEKKDTIIAIYDYYVYD